MSNKPLYGRGFLDPGIWLCAWAALSFSAYSEEPDLQLAWRDNILTISAPHIPGGAVAIWYLEAFCRSGSADRNWGDTVIPHKTELLEDEGGRRLRLRSVVEPGITVDHLIEAGRDAVTFLLTVTNLTGQPADIQWAQPCIRVSEFTGLDQDNYIRRCFIITSAGPVTLDQTRRTEEARYRGGQVYVPAGINHNDVNPRPVSPDIPVKNLIGCFSANGQWLLAMAWDHTQELFQGIITCIHADFRLGGLDADETKQIRGKLYIMQNDMPRLLERYAEDFGE